MDKIKRFHPASTSLINVSDAYRRCWLPARTSGVSSTFPRFRGRVPTRVPHRRLAIRAARFGPEAEYLPWEVGEKPTAREFHSLKKNEGPLRGQQGFRWIPHCSFSMS